MTVKLIIEASDIHVGTTAHELDQSLVTFGRSKSCHIELNHPEVSRRHFIIKFIEDAYVILDEGSSHGTVIDKKKLEQNKSYPLGPEHLIEVPGFSIKFFCDGQKPKFERTTVVARKLLDELLQGDVGQRECPCLEAKDGSYRFDFIEEKTSFVLGNLSHVDFVVRDEGIGKEHVSFARDFNGIRLNPLLGHEIFIDGMHVIEPQILTHGSLIKVGAIDFIFKEFSDNGVNDTPKESQEEERPESYELRNDALSTNSKPSLLRILDRVFLLTFLLVLASASVMLFDLI